MKEKKLPTVYKFQLSKDKFFILELPIPIEKFNKKDGKKLIKWMRETVDTIAIKSKLEAQARYEALLSEAEEIKRDYLESEQ